MSEKNNAATESTARSESEIARQANDMLANAAVGFSHLAAIFKGVDVLSAKNGHVASALAEAGAYWAESLENEMIDFQSTLMEKIA